MIRCQQSPGGNLQCKNKRFKKVHYYGDEKLYDDGVNYVLVSFCKKHYKEYIRWTE